MRKICYFDSTLHEMDTKSIARLKGKQILQKCRKKRIILELNRKLENGLLRVN